MLSRSEVWWSLLNVAIVVSVWVASGNTPCFTGGCKNGSLNMALVNLVSPEVDGVGVREVIVWSVFVGEVNGDGEEIESLVSVRV